MPITPKRYAAVLIATGLVLSAAVAATNVLIDPQGVFATGLVAALAMPAIWQLSGYVMALFLAGFRGIPEELREAARMDGASEFKLYRYVIFPQLSPVALSALVIVAHMSLKVFDLIMSITGSIYQTEVPATYLWEALTSNDYAKAATIATILLLIVCVFIVPYLVWTMRNERKVAR